MYFGDEKDARHKMSYCNPLSSQKSGGSEEERYFGTKYSSLLAYKL